MPPRSMIRSSGQPKPPSSSVTSRFAKSSSPLRTPRARPAAWPARPSPGSSWCSASSRREHRERRPGSARSACGIRRHLALSQPGSRGAVVRPRNRRRVRGRLGSRPGRSSRGRGLEMTSKGALASAPSPIRSRNGRRQHRRGSPIGVGGPARHLRHPLSPPRPRDREQGADPRDLARDRKLVRGNHALLSLAGPIAFIAVIAVWGTLVVAGFALILWPHFPDGFAASEGAGREAIWRMPSTSPWST